MVYSIKTKILFIVFLMGLFAVVDVGLNYTLYNPAFITPVYGYLLKHKIFPSEGPGYPLVKIHDLNRSLYSGPRAAVIATVINVLKSGDGDWHITVENTGGMLVTEITPEYPLPIPVVGDKIKIWGVTRFDIEHRWWELHPVFGWQKLSSN